MRAKAIAFIATLVVSLAVVGSAAAAPPPATIAAPVLAFPTYGNDTMADCGFAAAADWEIAVLHHTPTTAQVISAFYRAGGKTHVGIQAEQLFRYWRRVGIGGRRASFGEAAPTQGAVEAAVSRRHGVLAEMRSREGVPIGGVLVTPGYHMLLVDGYSPAGPTVVTLGQTLVMSWWEWRHEAETLYVPVVRSRS